MNLLPQPQRQEIVAARARRDSQFRGIEAAALAWLKIVARKRRPSTVENYRLHLKNFCIWLAGRGINITAQIGPDELREYGERSRQQEESGAYKASTVNNHLNPVRLWLRWLIAEAAVFDRAPDTGEPWVSETRVNEWLADVKDTSRPTRKDRALSAAEVARLLDAIHDPRDRALFSLLAGSGLRVSEACALRAGDVEVRPDGAGIVHVLDGKGGKRRAVVVDSSVVGHVYAWAVAADLRLGDTADTRPLWPPHRPTIPGTKVPGNLGSWDGEGRSVTRIRVYQLLQDYAKTAGIARRISPHNLRHTYGTERYRQERDPLAVANALGHTGLAYVQTYVKEVETGEAKPFKPGWEST